MPSSKFNTSISAISSLCVVDSGKRCITLFISQAMQAFSFAAT